MSVHDNMPNENESNFVRQSLVHTTYSRFSKPFWWFLSSRSHCHNIVPRELTGDIHSPIKPLVQVSRDDVFTQDKSKRATIGRYFDLTPLTSVEADLLLECEKNSLFTRSLPMAVGATILLNLSFRSGILQQRYVVVKYLLGLIAAYAGGKLSYANKCRQMIENKLPHSALAESVRTRRPLQDIVREREVRGNLGESKLNDSRWI